MSSSGRRCSVQSGSAAQAVRQRTRPPAARREDRAEAVVGLQRQHLERQPQRARRGARARALQADLAEVQLVGGEVGVGRVVHVEAPDVGVGEQHRAAAVGLQPVLVRVDDDRVARADRAERLLGHESRAGEQREEAAVRGVDVDAHAVALAPRQRLVDRVDRPDAGRPGGQHDRAHVAAAELRLDRVEIGAPVRERRGPRAPRRRAPGTCARACSGRRRSARPPCRGAARARPTAPRGSRSSRWRSGARATAAAGRTCGPAPRRPRPPSGWWPDWRRGRGCWG